MSSGSDCGGQREADRKGVPAEAREEIGAGLDGVEQMKAIDRSARSMRNAIFHADHDGGLGGALHHARSKDADDAAMPAVAIDNHEARSSKFRIVGEPRSQSPPARELLFRGGRD